MEDSEPDCRLLLSLAGAPMPRRLSSSLSITGSIQGAGGDRAALAQQPGAGMTMRRGRVLENTPGPGSLLAPKPAARPWGEQASFLCPARIPGLTPSVLPHPRPPPSRPLPPRGAPPPEFHLTAAFPCQSQRLAQNRGAGEPLLWSPSPHADAAPPWRQGSRPPSPWRGPER